MSWHKRVLSSQKMLKMKHSLIQNLKTVSNGSNIPQLNITVASAPFDLVICIATDLSFIFLLNKFKFANMAACRYTLSWRIFHQMK